MIIDLCQVIDKVEAPQGLKPSQVNDFVQVLEVTITQLQHARDEFLKNQDL